MKAIVKSMNKMFKLKVLKLNISGNKLEESV